jgi:tRNA 2-thiouridine synthesizing protein A
VTTTTVDARGMRCPAPILAIAKALKEKPDGKIFWLISDDPATEPDIQAWARMTGNRVRIVDSTNFEITKL